MMHIIQIECETIGELYTHLTVLKKQIKKKAKKEKLNPAKEAFKENDSIIDDNCYGYHSLTVYED